MALNHDCELPAHGAGNLERRLTVRIMSADQTASLDPLPLANHDPLVLDANPDSESRSESADESPNDNVSVGKAASHTSTSSEASDASAEAVDDLQKLVADAAKQSTNVHVQLVKAAYDRGLSEGQRRDRLRDAELSLEGFSRAVVEANQRHESAVSDVTRKAYSDGYEKGLGEQKNDEKNIVSAALQEGEAKRTELEAKIELLQQTLRRVGTARLALQTALEEKRTKQINLPSSPHGNSKKSRVSLPPRRLGPSQNDMAARALFKALRKSRQRPRRATSRLTAGERDDQRSQVLEQQLATARRDLEQVEQTLRATRNAEEQQRRTAEQLGGELHNTAAQLAQQREISQQLFTEGQQLVAHAESQAVTIRTLQQEREEIGRRYHEEMQALRDQLAAANQSAATAQQELAISQGVLAVATGQVRQQDEQLQNGHAQLSHLEGTIRGLQNDAQRAAAQAETQASTIHELQQEREELQRQAAELRQANETLRVERDTLSAATSAQTSTDAAGPMQLVETAAAPRAPSHEPNFAPQDHVVRETSPELDRGMESDGDDTESDEPIVRTGFANPAVRQEDNEDAGYRADSEAMDHEDDLQDAADSEGDEEAGEEEMVDFVFPTPGELHAYNLGEAAGRRAERDVVEQTIERRLRESHRQGMRDGEAGLRQDQAARQAETIRRQVDEGIAEALRSQGARLLALRQPDDFTDEEVKALNSGEKLARIKQKLIAMLRISFDDILPRVLSLTDSHITKFAQRSEFRQRANKDWIEHIQTFVTEVGVENVKLALSNIGVDNVSKELRNISGRLGAPKVELPGTASSSTRGSAIFGISPDEVVPSEAVNPVAGAGSSLASLRDDSPSPQPVTAADSSASDLGSLTFAAYGTPRHPDPSQPTAQQERSGTSRIPLARPLTDVSGQAGRGGNAPRVDRDRLQAREDRLQKQAPYRPRAGPSAAMRK